MSKSTKVSDGHPLWFVALGFFIGVALLVDARSTYFEVQNFVDNAVITQAEIIKIEYTGEDNDYLDIDYEYTVESEKFRTENERVHDKSIVEDRNVGDIIDAYYLPTTLDQSLLVGNITGDFRSEAYIGIFLFICFGSFIFVFDIPRTWQKPPLKGFIENGRWFIGISYLLLGYIVVVWLEPLDRQLVNIPFVIAFIVPIFISISFFLIVFYDWVKFWYEFRNLPSRPNRDVTSQNLQLSERATEFERNLTQLGFTPLGAISRKVRRIAGRDVIWLYHNQDYNTIAEIGCSPKYVQFYSWYGEVQRIEVSYPHGLHINLPGYQSRYRTDSINAAYRLHKRIGQSFRDRLGRAHDLRTIDDVLWWDTIYLQRHYKTVLWMTQRKYRLYIVVSLYVVAFTIIAFLLQSHISKDWLLTYVVGGMFGLFILNVVPRTIRARRDQWLRNYAGNEDDDNGEKTKT